jgi:hypothetical protein
MKVIIAAAASPEIRARVRCLVIISCNGAATCQSEVFYSAHFPLKGTSCIIFGSHAFFLLIEQMNKQKWQKLDNRSISYCLKMYKLNPSTTLSELKKDAEYFFSMILKRN